MHSKRAGRAGIAILAVGAMVLVLGAAGVQAGAVAQYDLELVPKFNIPKMTQAPKIDGTIDPAEWKSAVKVMGMVSVNGLEHKDRPVSFYLAWDDQHLYLAYRVDTLTGKTPHLQKAYREKYGTGVVFDDALEVGLFLHDMNKKPNEVSSYLKFVLNSLGSGEYMVNYPDIGQILFNWAPTFDIANRTTTDAAGKHWWEMEIAMDLQDLGMPRAFKAGDKVDIGLFADVKNPNWQWLDYPSASGHLESFGFPRAVLTDGQPYIQVEEIGGLHDGKLAYRSVVHNPGAKPVKVDAKLTVQDGTKMKDKPFGELADPTDVISEQKTLEISGNGSVRFDVVRDLPGLKAADKGKGYLRLTLTPAGQPQATPASGEPSRTVYSYACNFWGTNKDYVAATEYKPSLATRVAFTPTQGRLSLGVDTLDAPITAEAKPAGATYKVLLGEKELAAGKLRYFVNHWYDDLIELGELQPGKYDVALALVDDAGKELATSKGGFEKKDEAKEYAKWWNNKIGDAEKLLKPFEALRVTEGGRLKVEGGRPTPGPSKEGSAMKAGRNEFPSSEGLGVGGGFKVLGGGKGLVVSCTRRVYELGSLGLPAQIQANGGPVLSAPARIVMKIAGKEYTVPTDQAVKVTGQKDWRVDFECAPVTVAGVTFSATGWMEQDGLVELALTYAPAARVEGSASAKATADRGGLKVEGGETERRGTGVSPVAGNGKDAPGTVEIEDLRIEWPLVEDPLGSYMACMGQGNNYSARTIGLVPKGSGQVWNTRDDIGPAGSGRRVGNFVGNLWVGTEQRGLAWSADSDKGWEPDGRVAALALRREKSSVVSVQYSGKAERSSQTEHRTLNTEHSTVLMVNNLIGSAEGKAAFKLTEPRTVRFGYSASPFKNLTPGFRVNSFSCCGSFAGGKYKHNWDTKQEHFQILSPPFPDPKRWPEYYAHCKETVQKMMYEGFGNDGGFTSFFPAPGSSAYYGNKRHVLYTANQVPLRGYGPKSIENPNPYYTLWGDWVGARGASEFLSKTYRDYMMWLMDRQIKEGGCQHFYFDITMGEELYDDMAAGFGYRLPDGSIQPEAGNTTMREWYKRMWAMMQENDLYPGGVSGHSTHSFSLKMFPFVDCILDSEYPMQDSIDVYTSESMIALSCPATFGTAIQHHGNFMNPTWPMMHDAAGGDYRGSVLAYPEFKQWGMGRADIQFIPYWRNQAVVKEIAPGLIASLWKRPGKAGSAVIAIMNLGPNPDGSEPARAAKLTLDLKALGVPSEALAKAGDSVRIRQFSNLTVQNYYLRSLKWMQARENRALPPIEPKLDLASGTISGFDIQYHDIKVLALDWEEKPVDEAALKALAKDDAALRRRLLDWGFNAASVVPANLVTVDNPAIKVEAWKQAGDANGRGNRVLLRVTNSGDAEAKGTLKLDLKGLDVGVRKVWVEFTDAVPLDGQPIGLCETAQQPRSQSITYNAYAGEVYVNLPKGATRVFSVDRY